MAALQGLLLFIAVMIVPLAPMLGPSSHRVTDRDVRVTSRGFISEYIIDFDNIGDVSRISFAEAMIIPVLGDEEVDRQEGVPVTGQPDDPDTFVRRVRWDISS